MPTTYRKKILILGGLCLFFLAGVVILSFLGQRKTTQQRAFGTGATLKLTTANVSPNVGDEFIVEAKIDAAEKITIYRLALTYDKTKLAIIPITTGTGTSANYEVGPKFGYANGFVKDETSSPAALLIQSAYKVPDSGVRDPADLPTGPNTLLVKFKVKALAAGATQIAFRDLGTIINGYNPGQDDVVVSIGTKTPLALTIRDVTPPIGQVNVSLDPSTKTTPINQNFDVDIKVDAGTFKVALMNLELAFDKDQLEVVRFAPDPVAFTPDMSLPDDEGNNPVDLGNTTGIAKLFASTLKPTLATGVFKAGTITLKGKKDGVAVLTIRKVNTSFFGGFNADKTREGDLTINETVNGTYTIGAGGTGPVLNFKIKFQGITDKKPDQKVKVTSECGTADFNARNTFSNINVTADASGIYSGSVVLAGQNPGEKCTFFVKGPKHLARKLCEDNQTVRCPSGKSKNVILAAVNTLDFSKIPLEAGDLPNPNTTTIGQDGVVNSVDASLILDRIAKSDAASVGVADVNFDGIVNWGDMSLLLNTLETKYEEDY